MILCHIQQYGDGFFREICVFMKKVLHYVTLMNRAGEETFIMNVFRNINHDKVMFDFLVTGEGKGDFDDEIDSLGGKIFHIKLNRISGKLKQLDNVNILRKRLCEFNGEYDYFHIHTQHAMDAYLSTLAAKMAGIKHVIIHSHNASTIYSTKVHNVFKIFLDQMKITRFACGNDAGKWMFKTKKFEIINNGIDLDNFLYTPQIRNKIRKKMGWEGKFVVGHIGRFNLQKNHQFLIDAFYEFQKNKTDAILVLIGDGELRKEIERKVSSLNMEDKVQFLGVRDDVDKLYQALDLFVFPSLFEGLPVVLVETQAADLPCIISDTITNEVVINDNVTVLDLDSGSTVWASKIEKIYSSNIERKDTSMMLTQAGYNIVDVAKRLENFYLKGEIS